MDYAPLTYFESLPKEGSNTRYLRSADFFADQFNFLLFFGAVPAKMSVSVESKAIMFTLFPSCRRFEIKASQADNPLYLLSNLHHEALIPN